MRRFGPRSSLLALLALLARGPAAADEPAAAPGSETPAARTARLRAALPEPAAAQAWSFVGDMVVDASPIGTLSFSMEAVQHAGRPAWKAVDEMQVGPAGQGVHVRLEALLERDLSAIAGATLSEMAGEPTVTLSWHREGASYVVERRVGEQVTTRTLPSPQARLATMAAQLHLLRALPVEPADYAWAELALDANLGDEPARRLLDVAVRMPPVAPGEGERVGEGAAGPGPAVARFEVTAGEPEGRRTIVSLALADRALLAFEQPAAELVVRPRKPPAAGPADAPPTTAKAAALRAARALAVGDAKALGALLNWATVDARLAQDPDFSALEPAARRARLIETLDEQLDENPPQMIDMVLGGVEDALTIEDLGQGRARVVFPPIFRNMKLVVAKVGDAWYLDDLPGRP